jgi:hypothetical protein
MKPRSRLRGFFFAALPDFMAAERAIASPAASDYP